jgi:hypothetical protein
MIEFIVGLLVGIVITSLAIYPQLILLRGLLLDRHAGEIRKTGVKSVLKGLETPVTAPPEQQEARTQLAPPNLYERRAAAEKAEAEMESRMAEMRRIANDVLT